MSFFTIWIPNGQTKGVCVICLAGSVALDTRFENGHRKEGRQITTHHVYCQELFGSLRDFEWNQIPCSRGSHVLLHRIFGNRTPGESISLLRCFNSLVQNRPRQQAIEYLEQTFWRCLLTGDDPACIWPGQWRTHLRGHPKRKELVAVFDKIPPWKIVRWVNNLDALVGDRDCEEAVSFLSEFFWNGFLSDEWAMSIWNSVRRPRKKRTRTYHAPQTFHRPRFRLRTA